MKERGSSPPTMRTSMNTIKSLVLLLAVSLFGATAATAETVSKGAWTKKSNSISGSWSIEKDGDKYTLKLKGFKTKSAPDLKLFLSKQSAGAITGKNATSGAVRLAKLKSPKGDQTYVLPSGINPSDYKTLVLHCEKFSKAWGVGTL